MGCYLFSVVIIGPYPISWFEYGLYPPSVGLKMDLNMGFTPSVGLNMGFTPYVVCLKGFIPICGSFEGLYPHQWFV